MTLAPSQPPARHTWTAGEVFLAMAGFGMLAGLIEAAAAVIRWRIMHVIVYVGSEMWWQLPLADALIFLLVALLVVAVGLGWSRVREPRVVLAIGSALVVFAALLLNEKIHIAAEAVLAAGIGIGVARLLAPAGERHRRVLRYAVPGAMALLMAFGLAQRWLGTAAERREIASHPAGAASRPNILLLVLDTVRAWNLSLYGWGRPTTPKLSEWARQGTLFQRALAPAPWTTLSHAVMFTGRYPTELPVGWRSPLDRQYPTLAEVLRDAGYATSGFAGNYLNLGRGTGLSLGFVHYEDYPFQPIHLLRSTTIGGRILGIDRIKALIGRRRVIPGLVASDVNRRFLGWLEGQQGRPWFAFLNYFDAHGPYLPPAPFDTMYWGKADPPVDRFWNNAARAYGRPPVPAAELGEELDAYDGAITYLDLQVDSLLKSLAARGALRNTIVVVTSDHGELFGEHGVVSHGNNLYLPVLHVPLLIIAPGRVPADVRISSPTSLRDLPATLLALSGTANPGIPGHSIAGVGASADGGQTDPLFAAVDYNRLVPKFPRSPLLRGSMRTVVLDSLQYILNGDGVEELYHLGRDSWEVQNLARAPEYQEALGRYREALGMVLRTARATNPSR